MEKFVSLYPKYLDAGSTGAAVEHFIQFACCLSIITYNSTLSLEELFEKAVKAFQKKVLGYSDEDADGNFGVKTKNDAWKKGYHFNDVPMMLGQVTNWKGPEHEGFREHSMENHD